MKRLLIAVLAMGFVTAMAQSGAAQGNPRGKTDLNLGRKMVSVEYGRPSLNGRSVSALLDRLKPGDFWRLGADTSTTFHSALNLQFGDVALPFGKYSIWVQRAEGDTWRLVFNKQVGQWGTQHDPAQDFASVPLKQTKASDSAEMVTITLTKEGEGGILAIQWGDMKLTADFKPAA